MPGPTAQIKLPMDLKELFGDYRGAAKDAAAELRAVRKEAKLAEKEGRSSAVVGLRSREAELAERRQDLLHRAKEKKAVISGGMSRRVTDDLGRKFGETSRVLRGGLRLSDAGVIQKAINKYAASQAAAGNVRRAMTAAKVASGVGSGVATVAAVAAPVALAAVAAEGLTRAYASYNQSLMRGNLAEANLQGELGKLYLGRRQGKSMRGIEAIEKAQKEYFAKARDTAIEASITARALEFMGFESGDAKQRAARGGQLGMAVASAQAEYGKAFDRGKFASAAYRRVISNRGAAGISEQFGDMWSDFWSNGGHTKQAIRDQVDQLQRGEIDAQKKFWEDKKSYIDANPEIRANIRTQALQMREVEKMRINSFGDWAKN